MEETLKKVVFEITTEKSNLGQVIKNGPQDFYLMHPWGERPFEGTLAQAKAELKRLMQMNEKDEV